jgi:hypothetical protein
VHPKIFAAYQKQLRGKSLSQIYKLYQTLKQLPADYYLKNKLSEEILARHVEAYTIGWLLAADNLQTHAHTDNQLKNQILGKMHPALKALRFDDNSEYQMAMFSTIWKNNVTLRKILHASRDQIHDSEAVH